MLRWPDARKSPKPGWLGLVLAAAVAAASAAAQVPAAAATTALIPAAAFFAPAKLQAAALSPSGHWLAALTAVAGRRVGVLMIDVDGTEPARFIEASATDDVSWFDWVNDDWLVFSVRDTKMNRLNYQGGGLMAMRRDGSDSRQLMRRSTRAGYLGLGEPGRSEVLLGHPHWDQRGNYSHTTITAMNVATGASRRRHEEAPRADDWWFDAHGRARLVSAQDDMHTVYHWADSQGAWRQISRVPTMEPGFTPAYIDGEKLMVTTVDAHGDMELRPFDFDAGRPGSPALLATPGFDSGAAPERESGSGRVLGVSLALDAATTVWFDEGMKALQARVDARFPDTVNVLQCRPCDKPLAVLVTSYSDTDPGRFVLYRPQQEKWQLLGEARPEIDPRRMAHLALHRIQARDGKDLPVWVTRPPGRPADQPAPAVVLVHGGPHLRGTVWGWNAEAQFLASRGYVVIEPEFRGSTGYGDKHFRAGWKQWGLAMQDDITDALRFAVRQGWADAGRVCIMGASYGGYAALMGLVKDPDQYRCGIAFAAITDPRFRFEFHWSDASDRARRDYILQLMGDPKKDAAMLAANSPLEQVARIKAPVLLMHGDDDRRVPIEHGERMRDALSKHGKTFEWMEYVDEGHGFMRLKNELDYWQRIEAFLARHLR